MSEKRIRPILLKPESPLVIDPYIAEDIGLNEAIMLHQIMYWIGNAKKSHEREGVPRFGRLHKGKYWFHCSARLWKEDNFPFWSEDTIRRTAVSLEKKGLIESATGLDPDDPYNRSKWYSLNTDHPSIVDPLLDPSMQSAYIDSRKTQESTHAKPVDVNRTETTAESTAENTAHVAESRGMTNGPVGPDAGASRRRYAPRQHTESPGKVEQVGIGLDVPEQQASPKPKPKPKKDDPHPMTNPIYEAFVTAVGVQPTNIGREKKHAKTLAVAGFTVEEVIEMVREMASDPWYSKNLTLQTMATNYADRYRNRKAVERRGRVPEMELSEEERRQRFAREDAMWRGTTNGGKT